jgi:hypothetical protein
MKPRLEFIQSTILEPALEHQKYFHEQSAPSNWHFGAIEAAHWIALGARIGYLDFTEAQKLILSFREIFGAWSALRDRQIISAEDDWAKIIQGNEGELTLNPEHFASHSGVSPATRNLLHSMFQGCLLLTSESVFQNDTDRFLQGIGWMSDEDWDACKNGTQPSGGIGGGLTRSLEAGFGNVLTYWEGMTSLAISEEYRLATPVRDIWEDKGIGRKFSDKWTSQTAVTHFNQDARSILTPRFRLDRREIVYRYVELAHDFANRIKDESPEWKDARSRMFSRFMLLISYAGAEISSRNRQSFLWAIFQSGNLNSVQEAFGRRKPS